MVRANACARSVLNATSPFAFALACRFGNLMNFDGQAALELYGFVSFLTSVSGRRGQGVLCVCVSSIRTIFRFIYVMCNISNVF